MLAGSRFFNREIDIHTTLEILVETFLNVEIVDRAIVSLKSKPTMDYDGLSTELLKLVKNDIVQPLTLIINQIISSARFPGKLKMARVSTIFKKGDRHQFGNYRPVSILPALSKIVERILHDQMSDFFEAKHLLCMNQYGFRKRHSTELAAAELLDRVTNKLDQSSKNYYVSVFADLSKAFDCIDHNILLEKLEHYGLQPSAIELMSSYLNGRMQFVKINEVESEKKPIKIGVPQGSILGPLLFICYINDIVNASSVLSPILYADDSTLSVNIQSNIDDLEHQSQIQNQINDELCKVSDWLKSNRLNLNVAKTQYMIFKKGQPLKMNLAIDGRSLKCVETFNFLGLHINRNLTWTAHIDVLSKKVSRGLGIMRRLKPYLPGEAMMTLYYSLIHPHLQYQILNWGYEANKVEKLQKQAMRLVHSSRRLAHAEPLLRKSKILKVSDLHKMSQLKFYHKLVNEELPTYFLAELVFPRNRDNHDMNTRFGSNLRSARPCHEFARKIPRNSIPGLVNELDEPLQIGLYDRSLDGFARLYKTISLNNYSESFICENPECYPCNYHRLDV